MAIPILAKAGKLTGDRKYFDMAARHLAFMRKLVLRPDGLYRHSPLTDAAWGAGTHFRRWDWLWQCPIFLKIIRPFEEMISAFVQHMIALFRSRTKTDSGGRCGSSRRLRASFPRQR